MGAGENSVDYERVAEEIYNEQNLPPPQAGSEGTGNPTIEPLSPEDRLAEQRRRVLDAIRGSNNSEHGAQSLQALPNVYTRAGNQGGSLKLVDGTSAIVKGRFELPRAVKNRISTVVAPDGRQAVFTPTMYELVDAVDFHRMLSRGQEARSKYGAATDVYPMEKYEGMRKFVTEDGTGGFALDGDNIVSVFSTPGMYSRVTLPETKHLR